jgi:flagellar biosynthesis chaperone FliJ
MSVWSPAIPLAILILAACALLAPAVHATTYKWVDDQGKVHYTDKIPPEAVNKGSVELNKQGIPIKKTDPALTPEQRQAREAEEERARQAAKIREELQRKDRALLQSYTTEDEIELSKKRALGTIDGQIQSAQAYMVTLNKRKQEIETRAAAPGKSPQAQSAEREIANVNEELEKQSDLIATKRKEIAAVTARYDADKQRWRELRAIAETQSVGTTAAGGGSTRGGNAAAAPAGNKK